MTIYDIAKKAGVAGSTVSRVLNGQPGISEGTRKRILAIARAEGFELSENARALKKRSSMLIGILVSDIRNQHYTEGAYVMVEEFQKRGYCSIIMNAGVSDESKREAVRMLSSRRVDGAVFIGSSFSSEAVAEAVSTYMPNTPIVMENGELPLGNAYTVAAADKAGMESAVRYLASTGCRSLAYIILAKNNPAAIIYSMDILAAGGVRALLSKGIDIPGEVSVFGVDNSLYSVISTPSISSVDTSLSAMSAECVCMLESAMKGKVPERRIELPFSLVIRESTRK